MFVTADGKVQQRVLAVQRSVGNSWLVADGIKDGDRVIVEGTQRIRDGQDVTVASVTIDDASGELKQADAGDSAKPQTGGADKSVITGSTK